MKNKYNDNKLAEEFDLIVLTDDTHGKHGFHCGDLGTLTYAYTGKEHPLYAQFACADGTKKEEKLALCDFRVLNERNPEDLSLIVQYMQKTYKSRSSIL